MIFQLIRDLKLEHILICPEGHIRLIDLGLGRILPKENPICDTVCGTHPYCAPEVAGFQTSGYSYEVDFWAIGKMFMEMLCGELLYSSIDRTGEPSDPTDDLPNYRHISAEARSLARGLLETDPKKRLGSADSPHGKLEDHPFFKMGKGIEWSDVHEGKAKPISSKQPVSSMILFLIESHLH